MHRATTITERYARTERDHIGKGKSNTSCWRGSQIARANVEIERDETGHGDPSTARRAKQGGPDHNRRCDRRPRRRLHVRQTARDRARACRRERGSRSVAAQRRRDRGVRTGPRAALRLRNEVDPCARAKPLGPPPVARSVAVRAPSDACRSTPDGRATGSTDDAADVTLCPPLCSRRPRSAAPSLRACIGEVAGFAPRWRSAHARPRDGRTLQFARPKRGRLQPRPGDQGLLHRSGGRRAAGLDRATRRPRVAACGDWPAAVPLHSGTGALRERWRPAGTPNQRARLAWARVTSSAWVWPVTSVTSSGAGR